MFLLIEVAEIVFNKCITDNGLPKEHIDFQVKCNYEYLEDTFSEWGPSREFTWAPKTPIIEVAPDSSVSMTPSVGGKNQSLLSKIKNVSKSNYFKKAEFKIDHPLKYMVRFIGFTVVMSVIILSCFLTLLLRGSSFY